MIPWFRTKNRPKSGQKHGKSLFFGGREPLFGPKSGQLWGAAPRFFKNFRFFQNRKKVPKIDKKSGFFALLSTFLQEEKEEKVQKRGHFLGLRKKSRKKVKKWIFWGFDQNPKIFVEKSDFLTGSKKWSIFGPKCWNVFWAKSGKTNSPTAYKIVSIWGYRKSPKIDSFLEVFLGRFLDPQKMEVVKELLYPPIFGWSQNDPFREQNPSVLVKTAKNGQNRSKPKKMKKTCFFHVFWQILIGFCQKWSKYDSFWEVAAALSQKTGFWPFLAGPLSGPIFPLNRH